MAYQRKLLSRQGFTVIEIIVVVGIIAILAAIAIVGIGKVIGGQHRTQTRTILASAQSMLGEFDRETALKRQPPHMWTPANAVATNGAAGVNMDFWRDADPTQKVNAATDGLEGLNATTVPNMTDATPDDFAAVKNTQMAMYLFNQVAAVKKMLSGMPTDSMMQIKDSGTTGGYDEHAVAIPKDAWGNPIILVPASGLRGVTLEGNVGTLYVVTSVKLFTDSAAAGQGVLLNGDLAPGARPFFASAGPDGRLDTGDDNIYSFENK